MSNSRFICSGTYHASVPYAFRTLPFKRIFFPRFWGFHFQIGQTIGKRVNSHYKLYRSIIHLCILTVSPVRELTAPFTSFAWTRFYSFFSDDIYLTCFFSELDSCAKLCQKILFLSFFSPRFRCKKPNDFFSLTELLTSFYALYLCENIFVFLPFYRSARLNQSSTREIRVTFFRLLFAPRSVQWKDVNLDQKSTFRWMEEEEHFFGTI